MTITIDKGIPLPPSRGALGRTIYPFADMEIGDSIRLPVRSGKTPEQDRSRLSSCAASFCKRHPRYKFTTRIVDDGKAVRVWRVALHNEPLDPSAGIAAPPPHSGRARSQAFRRAAEAQTRASAKRAGVRHSDPNVHRQGDTRARESLLI